jgi:hypothetical protein
MAQDEGRFGRISEVRSCWAPAAMRPAVGKQIVREYVYAYAAVAPKLGKMTALVLPEASISCMNLFLKKVSKDFSNYFVIMQVDQAAWHTSRKLKLPDNIRFLPQPPCSPELNPVEHIWDDIREKEFSNRVFNSMDAAVDKLCDGLNRLASQPQYLASLTNFPHLQTTF